MTEQTTPKEMLNSILEVMKELLIVTKIKTTTNPDDVLTLSEAAELLKLSESTLNYYTDTGLIGFRRIGKHKRFIRQELLDWLVSGRQQQIRDTVRTIKRKNK